MLKFVKVFSKILSVTIILTLLAFTMSVGAAATLTEVPYSMDSSNQAGWWSPLETYNSYAYLAYDAPGSSSGTHTVKMARRDGNGNWTEMTCTDGGTAVEYTDDIGHRSPSIARDGDGYFHVFAGMHGDTWRYFRSDTLGGAPTQHSSDMPDGTMGITYPVVTTASNGDLYLIVRGDTTGSQKNGYLYRWNNSTNTWSRIAAFAGEDNKAIYTEDVQVDSSGDVHILFAWAAYPSSTIRHNVSYLKYSPSTNTFSTVDGTTVSVPVTLSTPNVVVQPLSSGESYVTVYNGADPGGPACQSSKMAIGSDNEPHIAYRYRSGSANTDLYAVKYAYYSNGWQIQSVYGGSYQTKASLDVTWMGSYARVYYVLSSGTDRVYYKDNSSGLWSSQVSVAPGKPIERIAVERNGSKDILYLADITNLKLYYGEN